MADKKFPIIFIICITIILTIVPLVTYVAGESAVVSPISFTKAAMELHGDVFQVAVEGEIASGAAYKEIACEIKDGSGTPVFFCQEITRMEGKFSFDAKWNNLNPKDNYTVFVKLKDGVSSECRVDNGFYIDVYLEIRQEMDELNSLINECKLSGLTDCAYEELAANIAQYFLPIINEKYLSGEQALYEYQADGILRILEKAQTDAKEYLTDTRRQRKVASYEVGDIVAEKNVLYTQNENRITPTFLTGYQIYEKETIDFQALQKLGINYLTAEVSLGSNRENPGTVFVVPYGFSGFTDDESKSLICSEDTIVENGNGAAKIVSDGMMVGIGTKVKLKANCTYEFGASVLADSDGFVQAETNKIKFSASDEWQKISGIFTTNAEQQVTVSVYTNGKTDGLYLDNVYIREKGIEENIIINGDFERGKIIRSQYGDFCYSVDTGWLQTVRGWLKEAENYNITMCIALSPHFSPGNIKSISNDVLDTGYNHNCFVAYNPTDEVYNELIRAMYDAAVETLGDCKALSMFMLANEPSFTASESPYYLQKWQMFLAEKYKTMEMLNAAYGTSYTDFAQIDMPKDVSLTKIYMDYREFNDSLLTNVFEWQTAYLKEKAPHIETVVKTLQSNNYISAQQKNSNHYENWAEFFEVNCCDTLTYYGDENNSLMIRGMWLDYMTSIKDAPIVDLETHVLKDGAMTEFDSIIPSWMETVLWHGAMHNVYLTTPWLFDNGTWRDFNNTLLVNRPECIAVIGEMNYDLNRLANEIGAIQSKQAKVAMYYSQENRDALSDNPKHMAEVYGNVVKYGESVDFIVESNPEKLNGGQYRLLILTDAKVVSDKMLDEINKFIAQGGKLVLVHSEEVAKDDILAFGLDGSKHETQKVKNIKQSAMILDLSECEEDIQNEVAEATSKNVRLVDAAGNDIEECEWSYVEYGDEYLISITNYNSDSSVVVYPEINGVKVAEFTDLRTLDNYKECIVLSPYTPVLLKTDSVQDTFEVTRDGKFVTAKATVVPNESLDGTTLIIGLYKEDRLTDVVVEKIDVSKPLCTAVLEKEISDDAEYRICRFIFNQKLSPITDAEERDIR